MYIKETDAVFGQELESFSQKSGVIQSGLNTMQTTFVLECKFSPNNTFYTVVRGNYQAALPPVNEAQVLWNTTHNYELRAYLIYDKLIAFDNTNGSVRAEY